MYINGETPSLVDIDTKGFVVVPDFLDADEISVCVNDFLNAKKSGNENYPLFFAGGETLNVLKTKVYKLAALVEENSTTSADFIQAGVYFSIKHGINLPWHQDAESFFVTQNHIDFLNFYMPIIKPNPDDSNLEVVPFDRLRSTSPEMADLLVGGGATYFEAKKNRTVIYSQSVDSIAGSLPYDIETISVTPSLKPGDLLLLRGDVIHRTQNPASERVALSVRLCNSRNTIDLKTLVKGGRRKVDMMVRNRYIYAQMLGAFKRIGKTEATFLELAMKFNDSHPTSRRFKRQLRFLRLKYYFQ